MRTGVHQSGDGEVQRRLPAGGGNPARTCIRNATTQRQNASRGVGRDKAGRGGGSRYPFSAE